MAAVVACGSRLAASIPVTNNRRSIGVFASPATIFFWVSAWLSIALFSLVDASCFQGFLPPWSALDLRWTRQCNAQSMAVGTVMVRWVSEYSDPVMATIWHMILGVMPLFAISVLNHDNAVSGNLGEFTTNDVLALLYTFVFGSAISYGVYFYSATKGSH